MKRTVAALLVAAGLAVFSGCKSEETSRPSAAPAPSAPVVEQVYVCPVHQDQTSTKADAKCPICGMAMVKKEAAPAMPEMPAAPETEPPAAAPETPAAPETEAPAAAPETPAAPEAEPPVPPAPPGPPVAPETSGS